MSDTALLVFARAPVSGKTKTRLIPALGAVGAAELHARMVRHTLRCAIQSRIGPVTLCCAPDVEHPFFAECASDFGIDLQPQQGNDLGQRMAQALEFAINVHGQALLIGTDCPDLGPEELRASARLLRAGDAVFVPATDGGYALIGVRNSVPAIFEGIAWGDGVVMEQTRIQMRRLLLVWHELPALSDIDLPADLVHLQLSRPVLLHGIIT